LQHLLKVPHNSKNPATGQPQQGFGV